MKTTIKDIRNSFTNIDFNSFILGLVLGVNFSSMIHYVAKTYLYDFHTMLILCATTAGLFYLFRSK